VLYAKLPSTEEAVNDLNREMANFWEVLKRDFDALSMEVNMSLHSRRLHQRAGVVYANPDMFDRIKRGWYLAATGYNARLDCAWGSDASGKRTSAL
jgi:DNA adenine methylase